MREICSDGRLRERDGMFPRSASGGGAGQSVLPPRVKGHCPSASNAGRCTCTSEAGRFPPSRATSDLSCNVRPLVQRGIRLRVMPACVCSVSTEGVEKRLELAICANPYLLCKVSTRAQSTSRKRKYYVRGPVAQLVSAPPCHGGGRGFKSRQGRIDVPTSQLTSRPDSSVGRAFA